MRALIFFLAAISLFVRCEECSSSASCIAPPDGSFEEGLVNLAVFGNILEEVESNSYQSVGLIDSLVVHTSIGGVTILNFYQWQALTQGSTITSIDFYFEEKLEHLDTEEFSFKNTEAEFSEGGYLLTVIKASEDFLLQIERASQDLVDGVCNDTFDC